MGLKKYAGEVIKEGKRVRWPKREVIFPLIFVVLVITAFAAAVLLLEDMAVARLLGALEKAFEGFKK
ncbi:MAG: preprotein translocase subunit SecE [Erysipelotrichaceae bacterium]|jgi:preprotein translocase SecE subunit|nr:preprotein translocase subunit SecE [Erysipelotrichaceae bacterium]HOF65305.1 preprotein translocase subunit SecE [Bacilli bacterium]HPK86133.1 preprotein translocase subunit SecE [Bacilli bacterium]